MVKTNPDKDKTIITVDEAMELIGPSERIHTYRSGGIMLIGADWDREAIIEGLKNAKGEGIEVAGPQARSMNHAIAFFDDQGAVFVETLPEVVEEKYPL